MQTRVKQFLALCFAVVLSVSLLVGCGGGDTSTPDGMLSTSLSAVKNGDLKAMSQILETEFGEIIKRYGFGADGKADESIVQQGKCECYLKRIQR